MTCLGFALYSLALQFATGTGISSVTEQMMTFNGTTTLWYIIIGEMVIYQILAVASGN